MNITKNIANLSLIIQWNAVEDLIRTTYITVIWENGTDSTDNITARTDQTSYTIPGLIYLVEYNIIISAANDCGDGPEYNTSVLFATGTYIHITPLFLHNN